VVSFFFSGEVVISPVQQHISDATAREEQHGKQVWAQAGKQLNSALHI
jgi:hypothetical protein